MQSGYFLSLKFVDWNQQKQFQVSTLRSYSPGGPFNTFATAPQNLEDCVTPNGHRLQRGLTGYLIPVAPHAFVPHCQTRSSRAPSPQVVLHGLKDFTLTREILPTSPGLKSDSISSHPNSLLLDFTKDLSNQLRTL